MMSYKVRIDPELIAMRSRFMKTFGMPIIELMDPKPGERILDVGCGFGAVCQLLDEKGCRTVGIDISDSVVEAARELGVDARLANAESMTFNEEFDAVYSVSALHWMRHLDRVAAGIMRALKPGGRFVGELGGRGSIVKIIAAIRQVMLKNGIEMESVRSWYFPSVSEFAAVLEKAGFAIRSVELIERPTVLPGDVRDWMKMFGRHYMDAWDPSEHERFLDAIRDAAAQAMVNEQGEWVADYRRLRFMAVKPE
ncbi:MAG: methyltransferase domain-containing protein [Alistipes senegalensis]|nr:methyltransferase domain-containing protein [Oxalobacter formigenes]MCM1281841.1 methyltransferase domain-containing protein [Alistipes senegalensis]